MLNSVSKSSQLPPRSTSVRVLQYHSAALDPTGKYSFTRFARSARGVASSVILSLNSCRKSIGQVGSSGSPKNFGIGVAIAVIGHRGAGAAIGEGFGLGLGVCCLVGFDDTPAHVDELLGCSSNSGVHTGDVLRNLSNSSSASPFVHSELLW